MRDFLLTSLGIPTEAQELARDDIFGTPPTDDSKVPAAALVVPVSPAQPDESGANEKQIDLLKDGAAKKLASILDDLKRNDGGGGRRDGGGHRGAVKVTREQEVRGRRGEEEFLRRIALPGGWMGFVLIRDTESESTGYDFVRVGRPARF